MAPAWYTVAGLVVDILGGVLLGWGLLRVSEKAAEERGLARVAQRGGWGVGPLIAELVRSRPR